MIAFASLYLGLVIGVQPVELVVDDTVARVELLLDGAHVAEIKAPPWKSPVNFGTALEPHELTAVAFDSEAREIGRARQWINLPRPPAEARILLDGVEDGRGASARVVWESLTAADPVLARVSFDGQPLEVDDVRHFPLPDHDPARLHYLRVELEFSGSVQSVVETTFGGSFTDTAASEQTAVPIVLAGRDGPRGPAALQGRFSKDGEPLRVLGVDEGPAEIILVRDKGVQPEFDEMARQERNRRRQSGLSLRYTARMKKDQRLRFLSPFPRLHAREGHNYELFPPSPELSPSDGGLFWLLLTVRPTETTVGQQRLSDAVAVAGMIAASRERRRAVVVLLGDRPADVSRLRPPQVRRYLEQLHVPLHVWSLSELSPETVAEWGEPENVGSLSKLEGTVKRLSKALNRQRIVWLEGIHLPQSVRLEGEVASIQLAN